MRWEKIYKWEVGFEGMEHPILQVNENILMGDLAKKYGQAIYIKLIPQNKNYKNYFRPIPKSAIPVYFRRYREAIGGKGGSRMCFCVGYKLNNLSVFDMIDSVTGDILAGVIE